MKLKTLKGENTRPTVDRVKESVFNIINPYLSGSRVLDLFSGTGALAIEALSRGATAAILVDADKNSCSIIRENLTHTRFLNKGQVNCQKVSTSLKNLGRSGDKFDIVFMDPPYLKNFIQETLQLLVDNDIIVNEGIVVVEHHMDEAVPEAMGCLVKQRTEAYGETRVSFLVREDSQTS